MFSSYIATPVHNVSLINSIMIMLSVITACGSGASVQCSGIDIFPLKQAHVQTACCLGFNSPLGWDSFCIQVIYVMVKIVTPCFNRHNLLSRSLVRQVIPSLSDKLSPFSQLQWKYDEHTARLIIHLMIIVAYNQNKQWAGE